MMLRYYVRWTAPDLSTTVRRFNRESDAVEFAEGKAFEFRKYNQQVDIWDSQTGALTAIAVDSPDNMIEGA